MITFEELNKQNHDITELTNVLAYLLADRSMCDTRVCCDLFYRYGNTIQEHLDKVDHTYSGLLSSPDNKINNTAKQFMDGSHEIRRIFSQYTRKWCEKRKQTLHIADHSDFYDETRTIFDLVLSRIQDETERLYPLIRAINGDTQRAA
jgi:hypothetical protein